MNTHPILNGISAFIENDKNIADLSWNDHPVFVGVSMKHLITSADTEGNISLHLVRIAPGCAIGHHAHAVQWELHQVLEGSGETTLNGKNIPYGAGTIGTIPRGIHHEVRAGGDGMTLLATFSPPLV